jgi:hypothetical protein
MEKATLEIINNVPYAVLPDGRKVKYADILAYNNPGMQYDDVTLDVIAATPVSAEAAPTPAPEPAPDVFGDTTARMARPYLETAADLAASAGRRPTYFEQPFMQGLERTGQYVGDMGLAGLNAVMGGMYGGAGLLGEAFGGDAQDERRLARDLAAMIDTAGPAPEGRMLGLLSDAAMASKAPTSRAEFLAGESGSVPVPKMLIGQHNLSPMGVKVASDIGGIPMPSMAISRADDPLTKFGDITLLTDPRMVQPSRTTSVWPIDAYTGRQPRGDQQFVSQAEAAKAMKANPNFGHMRDATYGMDAANNFEDADNMMRTAQLGVREGIDPSKYNSMWDYVSDVRAKLGYQAYEDAPMMPGLEAFADVERVLYPKEPFTASGNRRKPAPYTLDAVMNRMAADKAYTAGSEGWHYGPGSFRAAATPKFRTADEVKAARDLIVPTDQFESVKNAFTDAYDTVRGDLEQYAKDPRVVYSSPEAMDEIARGGSANWFGNVPAEVRGYVEQLASTARKMPTEYFEAKPSVAYALGDFPAALVPSNATDTADLLRNAGVRDVLTYGSDVDRADLIRRFPNLMFSLGAGVGFPLGLLAMQPNEEQY